MHPRRCEPSATDSVGGALAVSGRLGGAGVALADAAREAFVYAMSRAALVTAAIALVGAFVAWRFLPARALESVELEAREAEDTDVRRARVAPVPHPRARGSRLTQLPSM